MQRCYDNTIQMLQQVNRMFKHVKQIGGGMNCSGAVLLSMLRVQLCRLWGVSHLNCYPVRLGMGSMPVHCQDRPIKYRLATPRSAFFIISRSSAGRQD